MFDDSRSTFPETLKILSCLALLALLAAPLAAASTTEEPDAASKEFAESLAAAVAEESWSDLRLDAACLTDDGEWRALRAFGDGFGLWNREAQVRFEQRTIAQWLRQLHEGGFAELPGTLGDDGEPVNPKTPMLGADADGDADSVYKPRRILCEMSVRVGGASKYVRQIDRGTQWQSFRDLTLAILEDGATAAEKALRVASLEEGLKKILAGEVSPKLLLVHAHRKPDGGWIVHLEDGEAWVRRYDESGPTGQQPVAVSTDEIEALAEALLEHDFAAMPKNLWLRDYTDFEVRILGHEYQVQARQFAEMDPASHPEDRQAFEELVAQLREIALRASAP